MVKDSIRKMLLSSAAMRRTIPLLAAFTLLLGTLFFFRSDISNRYYKPSKEPEPEPEPVQAAPKYKPVPEQNPPIEENFPAAAQAKSARDIPPVPSYNQPRLWTEGSDEPAPLMIGVTRNWPILQQAVVSYLAAGWPASQIYVIDNTGTMNANRKAALTLQNPFYLDYHRLENVFGVKVITTPTLLTFAQLQNFMMSTALERGWKTYFWGHQDVVVLSDEKFTVPDKDDASTSHYLSIFDRAIMKRRELEEQAANPAENYRWGLWFFAYDRLALVNLEAYLDVGGWDPQIGYYGTDCDFHWRLAEAKWGMGSSDVGTVADVGHSLPDLSILYRRIGWESGASEEHDATSSSSQRDFGQLDQRSGEGFEHLRETIEALEHQKWEDPRGRNFWQSQQQGGQGEPFYKDSEGFEMAVWMNIAFGRKVYANKWGHRDCNLGDAGLKPSDAWRVEKDGDWTVEVNDAHS